MADMLHRTDAGYADIFLWHWCAMCLQESNLFLNYVAINETSFKFKIELENHFKALLLVPFPLIYEMIQPTMMIRQSAVHRF